MDTGRQVPSAAPAIIPRSDNMRQNANQFLQSFGNVSPEELLGRHFSAKEGEREIHEHGPAWAASKLPFLGRTFKGTEACVEYFSLLSSTLKMHPGTQPFPDLEEFVVDEKADCVTVKLPSVIFESVQTGKTWEEANMQVFSGWDKTGQRFRKWEVFADPLSAWMAVQ